MRLEARRFTELDLLQRNTVCASGYARKRYMNKLRDLLRPSQAICAYALGKQTSKKVRVRAAYQHAEAVCDEKEVGNRDGVTIRLEQTLFI